MDIWYLPKEIQANIDYKYVLDIVGPSPNGYGHIH
jgi:hypothetical protein